MMTTSNTKRVTKVFYTENGANYVKTLPDMPKGSIIQAMLKFKIAKSQITGHEYRNVETFR